mgnify:CR=1 FL=1
MKALGFDVKKAEVLKLLKDYDRDGSGNMYWDDFFDISKLSFYLHLDQVNCYIATEQIP